LALGGTYLLVIELRREQKIKIGKLGKFRFERGLYVYIGSAMRGLEARIERHQRKRKRLFWHIDYLLASRYIRIAETIIIRSGENFECRLNELISSLPGARFPVRGFGSSDCGCESHLIYFG
jgi:Uri superfamily endonuclease